LLAAYGAYTEAMKKAGVHVNSSRLPADRVGPPPCGFANGKTEVLDGPYAENQRAAGADTT